MAAPAAGGRGPPAPRRSLHAVQRTRERFFAARPTISTRPRVPLRAVEVGLVKARRRPAEGAAPAVEELGAGILGVLTLDPLDPAGDTEAAATSCRELVNFIV